MIRKLENSEQLKDYINSTDGKYTKLVHFSAEWCGACKQMDEFLIELLNTDDYALYGHSKEFEVVKLDAESMPEISIEYGITAVPSIIAFQAGKTVEKIDGFNPEKIKDLAVRAQFDAIKRKDNKNQSKETSNGNGNPIIKEKESINDRLKRLINMSRMTLFMKGSPDTPKCGFSRQIVDLLRQNNVDFWTFDILCDEEVRQGLKEYSDWPTYPQLYLDGELLGGLDVIREEMKNSTFVSKLPKTAI